MNRLKEFRQLAQLTQQDLARRVGAHWITISKLERGQLKLTTEWMERLAPHLGIQGYQLYAGEADNEGKLIAIEASLAELHVKFDMLRAEIKALVTVTGAESTVHRLIRKERLLAKRAGIKED